MADPESSSVQTVITNNDLLTEMLVRLPSLSLILFKSVSKHWFSLIKEADNLTFRRNPDPPSGLFICKKDEDKGSFNYDFVPFDIRIPLRATNFTFCPEEVHGDVEMLHSCNGLLLFLCRSTLFGKLYVNNPSITNMFKVIPEPDNVTSFAGGFKLAFDPSKSPHYKVVFLEIVEGPVQIHVYSSETGNWSPPTVYVDRDINWSLNSFEDGVYWNGDIYWLDCYSKRKFYKLDIMNEHPVVTSLRIPSTLYRNLCFECKLFESGGCLLLVGKGDPHSRHVTIFEKRNKYSQWLRKYIVNLDDIIKPSPKMGSIWSCILGEREEDSFLVIKLGKKVLQYKIVSKTLGTISHFGPNDDLFGCAQFIPSFANV